LLEQLIHNGIIIPDPPPYRALTIGVRGQPWQLTPKQEEMALAWVKKLGTPYVEDPTFVANFSLDFRAELATGSATGDVAPADLSIDEVDFGVIVRLVEAERQVKADLSVEERKAQAAARKAVREELKERYGHAQVNGGRVELGNYMSEPSGIFMGRGEHPLRGRWKEGATQADVTLNLSPDAPRPPGEWAEIVWKPESLWVARWMDKLSNRRKYVWLSDNSSIKQQREEAKFDKAIALHEQIDTVRAHIQAGLRDKKPRRRMIATACYLIDALCLRVGDEKEADEADTVGATTLRPEHVTLQPQGVAEFQFLGKDSVPWHKELALPPLVYETMEELIRDARPSRSAGNGDENHPTRDLPQIFPDIGSRNINTFLARAQKGLSAKVFRTHHATRVVQESLLESGVHAGSPEYAKWQAVATANLSAAILCNHTKKATGNWEASKQRYEERLAKARERLDRYRGQLAARKEGLQVLQVEAASKRSIAQARLDKVDPSKETRLQKARANLARVVERYEKRVARARALLETAQGRVQRTRDAIGKIEAQMTLAQHKRTWNLGTSLKSYIDPRVYVRWGDRVGYDVLEKYYPKALRRRFAWARDSLSDKGPLSE
jgi:DNA topoisomerase-1